MPLINESHDSLPYIDAEPSAQARANAEKLIASELPADYSSTLHPSIPAFPEFRLSPLIEQEVERKATGQPLTGGIDLSRYEAPEPPTRSSDAGPNATPNLEEWRQALEKAYTASSHLSMRRDNLTLLEENGKNAWLIGNSQLEDILRGLEKELAETNEAAETVNKQRKIAQETSKGELAGLEETWKRGVGAILDVELASENLRMQILEGFPAVPDAGTGSSGPRCHIFSQPSDHGSPDCRFFPGPAICSSRIISLLQVKGCCI
ncbi:breast carcinoma amplified sequence 2-domain-containing protein [Aspergillus leporis]|uniref:Breast carcinoma amplified sequence 2-domain-containing protein n=1 Tax=Aspergillus leporis TaxID=41062 RepID=A0A5N5WUB1_9EURO|nr:breast carcinoma amplified sequence 2-domain-containing protein [Aspergillus leporis]